MTEHRTDWHRLTVRTDDGSEVEALGWFDNSVHWVLDRFIDGKVCARYTRVTELGSADVLVLPPPSGPVVRKSWGWLCGDTEVEDLADADGWAAELPQHIADSRAIAAHIRGLGEVVEVPEPQVWLDPEPVVPRPGPDAPTLAEDVAVVRAWEINEGANYPNEEMARVLAAVDVEGIEIRLEGGSAALAALGRAIATALAGEAK